MADGSVSVRGEMKGNERRCHRNVERFNLVAHGNGESLVRQLTDGVTNATGLSAQHKHRSRWGVIGKQ
jgi:hypothetical protein